MSSHKKFIPDLLFGVQIIGAIVFCGAYIIRSLHDVTGSSIVQFSLVAAFLLFHLALSISAHKSAPSRVTKQAIATYVTWLVLIVALIITVLYNPDYRWNEKETAQLATAGILSAIVVAIMVVSRLGFNDPMIKAFFAIAYKSVPQMLLAWKFLAEGATGTPGMSVVVGHLTIVIRLGQIYYMVQEAGWDRNRTWLAWSEGINELSWIIATVAWLLMT